MNNPALRSEARSGLSQSALRQAVSGSDHFDMKGESWTLAAWKSARRLRNQFAIDLRTFSDYSLNSLQRVISEQLFRRRLTCWDAKGKSAESPVPLVATYHQFGLWSQGLNGRISKGGIAARLVDTGRCRREQEGLSLPSFRTWLVEAAPPEATSMC